ncbi:AraC family transcriptional regulator [Thauera butanivorans]|uniref:AraC family transcriptional regulator n=1 Tax=Thauera butanivorans TaxID=86174 RepID=UPI000837D039|nr:helix-turn-helix transcriptional regulator [Thauera butanivorans]
MGFASSSEGGHALDLTEAETSALPVTGVCARYPAGHTVPEHRHARGHLLYADQGVILVEAATGRWLVPPTAAVWLRPGVPHRLVIPLPLLAHGIFIRQDVCAELPQVDCVLHIGTLPRALIGALSQHDPGAPPTRRATLMGELLVEELRMQPALPFHLPWPADARMQQVCHALLHDPGQAATANDWAARLGMSTKTFHRRFQKTTGMAFGRWRQQGRLMASLPRLLEGTPITTVALGSGYESHSAYAVAFKKHFGQSPSAFVAGARHSG